MSLNHCFFFIDWNPVEERPAYLKADYVLSVFCIIPTSCNNVAMIALIWLFERLTYTEISTSANRSIYRFLFWSLELYIFLFDMNLTLINYENIMVAVVLGVQAKPCKVCSLLHNFLSFFFCLVFSQHVNGSNLMPSIFISLLLILKHF